MFLNRGVLFKDTRDREQVDVDPRCDPGDNRSRPELQCDDHIQVVFYDRVARRKA